MFAHFFALEPIGATEARGASIGGSSEWPVYAMFLFSLQEGCMSQVGQAASRHLQIRPHRFGTSGQKRGNS